MLFLSLSGVSNASNSHKFSSVLNIRQKPFDHLGLDSVQSSGASEKAAATRRHPLEQVTGARPFVADFASSCFKKSFLGTAVAFKFWHKLLPGGDDDGVQSVSVHLRNGFKHTHRGDLLLDPVNHFKSQFLVFHFSAEKYQTNPNFVTLF